MKRVVLIALACGLAACGADPARAPVPSNGTGSSEPPREACGSGIEPQLCEQTATEK